MQIESVYFRGNCKTRIKWKKNHHPPWWSPSLYFHHACMQSFCQVGFSEVLSFYSFLAFLLWTIKAWKGNDWHKHYINTSSLFFTSQWVVSVSKLSCTSHTLRIYLLGQCRGASSGASYCKWRRFLAQEQNNLRSIPHLLKFTQCLLLLCMCLRLIKGGVVSKKNVHKYLTISPRSLNAITYRHARAPSLQWSNYK